MTEPILRALASNGAQADSWTPTNLNALADKPPVQPTLGSVGIVYPGKRHVFSGPPESAKTLIAYVVLIQVVRQNGPGILIDFEMGGYDARSRLRELGATNTDIDRIHYLEPDEPGSPDRISRLIQLKPSVVVIDAAAGAYSLQGLDDNKRADVETFARLYVGAFWRNGIATIVVDHVVKDRETRGSYAIGSERKLGGADIHLGFETVTPISRGTTGRYKIITHKDRGGWLKRGRLADVELSSDPESHQIAWTLTRPEGPDTAPGGEHFRPTHLMEKVSILLEASKEPLSRNEVYSQIGGTKKWVLGAITALVIEGFAAESDGAHRAKPVHSIRQYRENDAECNPEKPENPSANHLMASSVLSEQQNPANSDISASIPVVRSGSPVVREPQSVGGSGGSPPYGGDTSESLHSDHPEPGRWFAYLQWAEEQAGEVDLEIAPGTLDEEHP